MKRTYDYEGYTLEISVEEELTIGANRRETARTRPGHVAIVRIFRAQTTVAMFSPLRFGEAGGRPFASEADALMGGFSAASKIVDDLFYHDQH